MIKMVPLVCPKCGAQLEIKEGTDTCYCTYCGTKILVKDASDSIDNRADSHDTYNTYDNSTHTTINKRGSIVGDVLDYFEQKDREKKEEEKRQRQELERQEKLEREKEEKLNFISKFLEKNTETEIRSFCLFFVYVYWLGS